MTSDRPEISTVLIDWAGTITVPLIEVGQRAGEHLGIPFDQLVEAIGSDYVNGESIIHLAERGDIDDDELVERLGELVPGGERLFDLHEPSILTAPERPAMIELLEWMRDEIDVTVMMATNNFAMAQEMLATRFLDSGLVHAVINSALIGARKPEPEFWDVVLETAMVDAPEIVLLDDSAANLTAAADLGMHTIEVGADETPAIAELRTLLT